MAIASLGTPKQAVFSTRAKAIKQAKREIDIVDPDDPLQNQIDEPNQTLAQNTLEDTPQDTLKDAPQDTPQGATQDAPQDTPQGAAQDVPQDPISEPTPIKTVEPGISGGSEAIGSEAIGGAAVVSEAPALGLSNVMGVVGGVNITAGGMLAAGGGVVALAALSGGGGGGAPVSAKDATTPTVTSVVASDPIILNSNTGGVFSITVTFSEAMNTAATPTLVLPAEVAGTLTFSNGVWSAGVNGVNTVYTANYNVFDVNVAIPNVTVSVTGAQDAAGNAQQDYTPSQPTFSIDTLNPTVISVVASDILIADADVGAGTFNIAVTFDEPMDTAVVPTLTFTPGVTGTLTQNILLSGWSIDQKVYTAIYSVTDANVFATDVTVDVTGAQNAGGIPQSDYTAVAKFSIDTQNPTVAIDIVATLLSDATNTSNVTFTFSEDPGTSFTWDGNVGDVVIAGGTLGALVQDTATTYHASFTAGDNFNGLGSVTINAGAFTDAAGNGNLVATLDTVTIDTVNPTVASVVASSTMITDADVGAGTFNITVTFDEPMNTTVVPTLTLPPAVAGTLTFSNDVWSDGVNGVNSIYIANYNVFDVNVAILDVTVDVTGAQDAAGNAQQDYLPTQPTFSIDTLNPAVVSVVASDQLITDADVGVVTFSITVTFDQAMNPSFAPTITFNPDNLGVSGTLIPSGGAWNAGDNPNTVYTATYSVADAGVAIPNVTVNVTGAKAANGSPQQDFTSQPIFSIITDIVVSAGDDTVRYFNLNGLAIDAGANGPGGDTLTMIGTEAATVDLVSVDQTTGDNTIVNNFENINRSHFCKPYRF